LKKLLNLQIFFLFGAGLLGALAAKWPWFSPVSALFLVLLIGILVRKFNKISKTSLSQQLFTPRVEPMTPQPPGSAGRPVGEVRSFLEDIRARGFVPRGILDIGANRGDWTKMALEVYPAAQSVLVEPQDEMEPYLQSLCATDPRCRYFKCGAGREEGELVLTLWKDTYGSSYTVPKDEKLIKEGKQRITPIRTVDGILREVGPTFFPDLVKVDVQGFELEVLKGGSSLIDAAEVMILETTRLTGDNPAWPLASEIIEFMCAKEYAIYDITSFLRRPSDGALWQADFAFAKAKGKLRRNLTW